MKKTRVLTKLDIKSKTHIVDAKGLVLGKLAVRIASLLTGKHRVLNSANLVSGDKVEVINTNGVTVTGKKLTDKIYRRHTGFPQGDRQETMARVVADKGKAEVLRRAVWGMLPNNKLRDDRIKNLKIYEGGKND